MFAILGAVLVIVYFILAAFLAGSASLAQRRSRHAQSARGGRVIQLLGDHYEAAQMEHLHAGLNLAGQ